MIPTPPSLLPPTKARERLRQELLQLADIVGSADVLVLEAQYKKLKHALTAVKFERWIPRDEN
jgi:hypothetical protein